MASILDGLDELMQVPSSQQPLSHPSLATTIAASKKVRQVPTSSNQSSTNDTHGDDAGVSSSVAAAPATHAGKSKNSVPTSSQSAFSAFLGPGTAIKALPGVSPPGALALGLSPLKATNSALLKPEELEPLRPVRLHAKKEGNGASAASTAPGAPGQGQGKDAKAGGRKKGEKDTASGAESPSIFQKFGPFAAMIPGKGASAMPVDATLGTTSAITQASRHGSKAAAEHQQSGAAAGAGNVVSENIQEEGEEPSKTAAVDSVASPNRVARRSARVAANASLPPPAANSTRERASVSVTSQSSVSSTAAGGTTAAGTAASRKRSRSGPAEEAAAPSAAPGTGPISQAAPASTAVAGADARMEDSKGVETEEQAASKLSSQAAEDAHAGKKRKGSHAAASSAAQSVPPSPKPSSVPVSAPAPAPASVPAVLVDTGDSSTGREDHPPMEGETKAAAQSTPGNRKQKRLAKQQSGSIVNGQRSESALAAAGVRVVAQVEASTSSAAVLPTSATGKHIVQPKHIQALAAPAPRSTAVLSTSKRKRSASSSSSSSSASSSSSSSSSSSGSASPAVTKQIAKAGKDKPASLASIPANVIVPPAAAPRAAPPLLQQPLPRQHAETKTLPPVQATLPPAAAEDARGDTTAASTGAGSADEQRKLAKRAKKLAKKLARQQSAAAGAGTGVGEGQFTSTMTAALAAPSMPVPAPVPAPKPVSAPIPKPVSAAGPAIVPIIPPGAPISTLPLAKPTRPHTQQDHRSKEPASGTGAHTGTVSLGWIPVTDPTGRKFYYNLLTKGSQWHMPGTSASGGQGGNGKGQKQSHGTGASAQVASSGTVSSARGEAAPASAVPSLPPSSTAAGAAGTGTGSASGGSAVKIIMPTLAGRK